ncbi:ribbon-helix-helix protein, CopG family [Aquibium sp. ELW1220]|nr:ribbon-helix-helix protein, CopG family [Aquibium sp. ELW1220]MDN2579186.1 ribbon-helix-helix protein, CopG family [Aquibium sp. ELW1220]
MVRLQPEMLAALDRFIAETDPSMSRPEAMRRAFHDWAIGQGIFEADER